MLLVLEECTVVKSAFFMEEEENGGFYLKLDLKKDDLCFTPLSKNKNSTITSIPCQGDPIGLKFCEREASRILPIEEKFFQKDRRLLKKLLAPKNSSCDFKACTFNEREPIKLLPDYQIKRCSNLWECVTITVKTARRPHLVVRLARSVRNILGFDIPIIAYDDGPHGYSGRIKRDIAEFPLLQYVVSSNEDLGISKGRNLAVMRVKTKYFLLLDDDIVFNEHTHLDKLVEVLDTTDATVASAVYMYGKWFSGYLQFGYFNNKLRVRRLGFYHQACKRVNQTIPNHPDCFRCDITSNIFLARTKEILDIGGWDPELMTKEHKDIFIRLKAAGMKVALCPHVKVTHDRPVSEVDKGDGYREKRHRDSKR